MAKDNKKGKKSKKGKGATADAFAISGIHLLALDIERMATAAYVTHPGRLNKILRSLRNEIIALHEIGEAPKSFVAECPDPYISCDELCVMFCEDEIPSARSRRGAGPESERRQRKG